MNTNSSAPTKLYIGLDVHKAETVIAILEIPAPIIKDMTLKRKQVRLAGLK